LVWGAAVVVVAEGWDVRSAKSGVVVVCADVDVEGGLLLLAAAARVSDSRKARLPFSFSILVGLVVVGSALDDVAAVEVLVWREAEGWEFGGESSDVGGRVMLPWRGVWGWESGSSSGKSSGEECIVLSPSASVRA